MAETQEEQTRRIAEAHARAQRLAYGDPNSNDHLMEVGERVQRAIGSRLERALDELDSAAGAMITGPELERKERQEAAEAAREAQAARRLMVVPPPRKGDEILGHLLPGEPFFVFRAKDILSTFALDEYAKIVEKFTPHSPQLESLVDAINEFRAWQVANPDKVKLPD